MHNFGYRWQVRHVVWAMLANYKGGLEHAASFVEVSALLAH